jgi:hypothetical protein
MELTAVYLPVEEGYVAWVEEARCGYAGRDAG